MKEGKKMEKSIKIKSAEQFTIFNNDEGKTVSAVVEEKEYIAKLYKPTQEYFAKDKENREFLVGEIDIDGNLILETGFQLIKR